MARAAMNAGILPNNRPGRVWGGRGTGATCAVCARCIDAIEPEFELDLDPSLRMHARCFAVWDQERVVGGTGLEPVTPAV